MLSSRASLRSGTWGERPYGRVPKVIPGDRLVWELRHSLVYPEAAKGRKWGSQQLQLRVNVNVTLFVNTACIWFEHTDSPYKGQLKKERTKINCILFLHIRMGPWPVERNIRKRRLVKRSTEKGAQRKSGGQQAVMPIFPPPHPCSWDPQDLFKWGSIIKL